MQYSTRELAAAYTLLQLQTAVPHTDRHTVDSSEADSVDSSEADSVDSSEADSVDSSVEEPDPSTSLGDFAMVTCIVIFMIHGIGLLVG